jgi:hypothetical protein
MSTLIMEADTPERRVHFSCIQASASAVVSGPNEELMPCPLHGRT